MNLGALERFARAARTKLMREVADQLDRALPEQSLARREHPAAVRSLELALKAQGREKLIEQTAYTWFNRLCAFRFMDVQGYTAIKVVSCVDGNQPEILAEARNGVFDGEIDDESVKSRVRDLLAGRIPTLDPRADAYRILFTATCNAWQVVMPFLFEKIDDWTEILMPNDLLSEDSILADVRAALTEEDCQTIEVIGWLYQFYIGEKKETVLDRLKRKSKVDVANIPAATQLFTPKWIVSYMVENSLGRLWMRNHPDSSLKDQMRFWIPDDPHAGLIPPIPGTSDPARIRVCDSACGSAHILVYAFDLLYAMYEEAGYSGNEIPGLILSKNLYGFEIDERAAALASFALVMKARAKYRRFFRNMVQPHIVVFEERSFSQSEIDQFNPLVLAQVAGVGVPDLEEDLNLLQRAKSAGSLLQPKMSVQQIDALIEHLSKDAVRVRELGQLDLGARSELLAALRQLRYLAESYHCVIANPPYLGSGGMEPEMSNWIKSNYADYKSDLFSAFVVRNTQLCVEGGFLGFMTPFVWMFISSYEKLREYLIDKKTITSLIQLEYSGFAGATVPICTFTLENIHRSGYKGGYVRLSDFKGAAAQEPNALRIIEEARNAGE